MNKKGVKFYRIVLKTKQNLTMIKRAVILFSVLILCFACTKESKKTRLEDLHLITGLSLVKNRSEIPIIIGNPNDKTEVEPIDKTKVEPITVQSLSVYTFPNPVVDIVRVSAIKKITSIWIVTGRAENIFQHENFHEINKSIKLDTLNIVNKDLLGIKHNLNSQEIALNLSEFNRGFYKIIIELEDRQLVWTSIYKVDDDDEKVLNIWK